MFLFIFFFLLQVPIVDSNSIFSDTYDLSQILDQYNQRTGKGKIL